MNSSVRAVLVVWPSKAAVDSLVDRLRRKEDYNVLRTIHSIQLRKDFTASSIYSWSIGHILEHELFRWGRWGSQGSKGKKWI